MNILTGNVAIKRIWQLLKKTLNSADLANYSIPIDSKNDSDTKRIPLDELRIALMNSGLFDYRGDYDASVNLYPSSGGSGTGGAILKANAWIVSVGGTIDGNAVIPGQILMAKVDNPGQTSANWFISDANAIHVNSANEINSIAEKVNVVDDDILLGEDSESTPTIFQKIKIKISSILNQAKDYADSLVVGLWDDRGNYDASVNEFPSSGGSGTDGVILKGDIWLITVAGTLGGVDVVPNQTVRALQDTPGQTAGNWAISTGGGSSEKEIINCYIVGETPLASDWLSLTVGGAALTPTTEKIYIILTAGVYLNTQYRWDGSNYVSIDGGGTSSDIEPYEFTYDNEIDLSKLNGWSQTTLTSNDDFTPKTATSKHGFSHLVIINPDGYTPTFSGFELIDTGFDWNPNTVFQVLFQRIGLRYFYSIFPYIDQLTLPVLNAITIGSPTQLNLSWSTVTGVSSWRLEYSLDGLTNWTQIGGIIDAGTLSYSHTGLTTGVEYHYRIKAIGDHINYIDSNYSDIKINSATNAMFDGFESANIAYTNDTHLLRITSRTSAIAKNSVATTSTQIVEFRLSNDYNSYGMVLCLHGSNAYTDYASAKHTIHMSVDGNQMKYKYNGGSFVSSGVKFSPGRRFRMRRGGGNIYWEFSDDNGVNWTEVFSGADSGTLYILTDCKPAQSATGILICRTY